VRGEKLETAVFNCHKWS